MFAIRPISIVSTVMLSFLVVLVTQCANADVRSGNDITKSREGVARGVPIVADTVRANEGVKPARKSFGPLSAFIAIAPFYDDNIFDYSSAARTAYDSSGSTNSRFAIKSLSDLATDIDARVDYQMGKRKSSQWRIRLRSDARVYDRNRFRSYNQFGFELRVTKRRSYIELSSRLLPKYNLRALFWRRMPQRPQGVRYAAADYSKFSLALEVGTRLNSFLDWRIGLERRRYNYVFPFDERDNSNLNGSSRLTFHLTRQLDIYVEGGLGSTKAAGKDSSSNVVNDISNNQTELNAGFRWGIDRREHIILGVSADYLHQKFSSIKLADVSHFHRTDKEYDSDMSLTWRINPFWQPEISASYRTSTSTAGSSAVDAGSFKGYRIGVQLSRYF
jgi:hypothetical protein